MSDPVSWSLPLGRLFGINIRVHVLFPLVAVALILRAGFTKDAPPGVWLDATMLVILLFVIVLLHEFGHCFGARWMDGDAQNILIWPLGGLAFVEVPRTARANFVATAAGPFVNLLICVFVGLAFCSMTDFKVQPPWNPLPVSDWGWSPYRDRAGELLLYDWSWHPVPETRMAVILLARTFWLSLVLFVLNVFLPAFPLDGGRMFQCALWPRLGFQTSLQWALFAGLITGIIVAIGSLALNEVMLFFLAIFVFWCCRQQMIAMETSGEDAVFGYDFSQGYTSLERDEEEPRRPPRRRPNMLQRWRQNRLARKVQREEEVRQIEEQRMDALLEKVQQQGLQALTEEESRFLKRVSDKYRNRR
jgi:stage IV sporulation protein FB